MRHKALDVLVWLDGVYVLVDIFGMAGYEGKKVAGLDDGGGDFLVELDELKSNKERHAVGVNELLDKGSIFLVLGFGLVKGHEMENKSDH